MENPVVSVLKKILSLVPEKAIRFTYLKIFKPKPLRAVADTLIKLMTPASVTIPEGIVNLNKGDPAVSGALALGAHDPFEIECFRRVVKAGMNVIDIGANIGYYSVIAAGRVGPKGKVFSYEPEGDNFALLQKNIEVNRFTWARAIRAGLSDQTGKRKLFVAKDHTGIHSFADNRGVETGIEIEIDTLDRSLERFGSPKIDLIKIDIEGAEILALTGMKKTLAANPDMVMFIELYPQAIERLGRKPIELLNILKDSGFTLSVIDEDAKALKPLFPSDFESFIQTFPARGEVARNIYASKVSLNG